MEHINWNFVKPCLWSGASASCSAPLSLRKVSDTSVRRAPTSWRRKNAKRRSSPLWRRPVHRISRFAGREITDGDPRCEQGSYQARDAFPAELVTLPGKTYIDYSLVKACQKLLLAPAPLP